MKIATISLALSLLFASAASPACDIPVFRYALDYWPADVFQATLFHEGALDEAEAELYSNLEEDAFSERPLLNLAIDRVDLSNPTASENRGLYDEAGAPVLPSLILTFPGSTLGGGPVVSVPFEAAAVAGLLDSPKRRELTSRIKSGDSAVWVFLESGDAEKDREALATLEAGLAEMGSTLTLPTVEDDPNAPEELLDPTLGAGPPLKIAFSILPLSRDDPEEQILVNLLLKSEPDLLDPEFEGEPMAFPVYGRGRVLYAVIGKGINEANIREACEFLVGPCSCQVKDLNPGSTDLLLAASWGDYAGPPAQGLQTGVLAAVDGLLVPRQPESERSLNLGLVLAIQVMVVIGVSLYLVFRRREPTVG